jgi:hypothetical protein
MMSHGSVSWQEAVGAGIAVKGRKQGASRRSAKRAGAPACKTPAGVEGGEVQADPCKEG